jgi:hypothetical protein
MYKDDIFIYTYIYKDGEARFARTSSTFSDLGWGGLNTAMGRPLHRDGEAFTPRWGGLYTAHTPTHGSVKCGVGRERLGKERNAVEREIL